MPIDAVKPRHIGQYFQVPYPYNTAFRVSFSCSRMVRFLAMSVPEMQKFLQQQPCTAFIAVWMSPGENQGIDFVVPAQTPWAIVIVNQTDEHVAVYWQNYLH